MYFNTICPTLQVKSGAFGTFGTQKKYIDLLTESYKTAKNITTNKMITVERKELWEDTSRLIEGAWRIGGAFYVINEAEEKLGGKPYTTYKILDFISTVDANECTDLGF